MTRYSDTLPPELAELILRHVDSVPHLEVLVMLWDDDARGWTESEIARRMYQPVEVTRTLLRDLQRHGLIEPRAGKDGAWGVATDAATRDTITRIAKAYQTKLSQVATLIHSRPPQPVREFARAFELRGKNKDKERK